MLSDCFAKVAGITGSNLMFMAFPSIPQPLCCHAYVALAVFPMLRLINDNKRFCVSSHGDASVREIERCRPAAGQGLSAPPDWLVMVGHVGFQIVRYSRLNNAVFCGGDPLSNENSN